jgi:hypothetical protein
VVGNGEGVFAPHGRQGWRVDTLCPLHGSEQKVSAPREVRALGVYRILGHDGPCFATYETYPPYTVGEVVVIDATQYVIRGIERFDGSRRAGNAIVLLVDQRDDH